MDRLKAMATFVAIADHGSLTEAALRLGRSLPTVVRTLATLERHLETRLFNRTTRRVELTEEGALYLRRCRHVLAEIDQIEAELSGDLAPAGPVSITAPIALGQQEVAPRLAAILERHPGLQVRLTLADRVVDIVEQHVDIAVRIGHLADSTLKVRRLGAVAQVLCAAPSLLARHGRPEVPDDLGALPCVLNAGNDSGTRWPFRGGSGRAERVRVSGRFSTNTVAAAVAAARAGTGFGLFLSYQVADDLRAGRLVRLLRDAEPEPLPVQLVHAATRHVPRRMAVVLDELGGALSARLRSIAADLA